MKSGGGRAASAYSEQDGRFTVFLPNDAPYSLQATHADFLQWGDDGDKSNPFPQGTRDLLITMERAVKVRVLVVDDETDEPIERYGFRIYEGEGSKGTSNGFTQRQRPRSKDRPGGEHKTAARARQDLMLIYAPGYLFYTGDVDPAEESIAAGTPTQTVRLRRGSSLVGRLLRGSDPIAGADVEFVAGNKYRDSFSPDEDTLLRTTTDKDGRFSIGGLKRHSLNRLTLTPSAGSATVLRDVKLRNNKETDLGDIQAVVGGTITGQLVAPSGIDVSGVKVYLGPWRDRVTQMSDSSGRFRFENVPPGEQNVVTDEKPGLLASGGSATCAVVGGESVPVTIDLARQTMVHVTIALDLGGLPTEGIEVSFRRPEREKQNRFHRPLKLGFADEHGVAAGMVPSAGDVGVQLRIPGAGYTDHPSAMIHLEYGDPIEETVKFEFAAARITLPEGTSLPDRGTLQLVLQDGDSTRRLPGQRRDYLRLPIVDGKVVPEAPGFYELDGNEHVVRGLFAGPSLLTIYAVAKGAQEVKTELGAGSYSFGPKRDFEFKRTVNLTAGEETRIYLP